MHNNRYNSKTVIILQTTTVQAKYIIVASLIVCDIDSIQIRFIMNKLVHKIQ